MNIILDHACEESAAGHRRPVGMILLKKSLIVSLEREDLAFRRDLVI
jgi:hypothetical protein